MRSLRASPLRQSLCEVFAHRSSFAFIALLSLWPISLSAQEAPANPAPYTLHVYTNLIQVPTLVVTQRKTAAPPIPIDRFNITLDSGHPFHPTAMHIEGDDPIDLAVLLDASGPQNDLLKTFSSSFAALAPKYLHPADHVSIYALDCSLVRTLEDIPADASAIRAGVTAALQDPALHAGDHGATCSHTLLLRDAMVQIMNSMGDDPGRRVLLAVTNGHDGHSTDNWAALHRYASIQDVAAFGMRDVVGLLGNQDSYSSEYKPDFLPGGPLTDDLDLFRTFCEFDGGMVYDTSATNLENQLQKFVTMLRGRYIVEFPRPNSSEPGFHSIHVTISGSDDVVLSSGVTFPAANPESSADPNALAVPDALPATKSPATYGKRHPVNPPQ